ncbi:unnamed protein product, partial [Polarella glacialis]
ALMKQRRWIEAIDHCNRALRHDPAHSKSSWRGATAAIEVGMHDVAFSFVENGLEETPECEELLELSRKLGPLPDSPRQLPPGGSDDEEMNLSDFKLPSEAEKDAARSGKPVREHQPGKEKGD